MPSYAYSDCMDEKRELRAVLEQVAAWLDTFYDQVEYGSDGEYSGMTQLDHGHEEYEARMAVAVAVRAAVKR